MRRNLPNKLTKAIAGIGWRKVSSVWTLFLQGNLAPIAFVTIDYERYGLHENFPGWTNARIFCLRKWVSLATFRPQDVLRWGVMMGGWIYRLTTYSVILLVVFMRACLCLSILAKPLYPQETVYINKRCYLGPLLSRDLMRSLPDAVRGSVVGPEKHNVMRLCMQHLVSASINPKQVLELFSREFYQSKKNR